jgi:hypothetical protein
MQLLTLKSSLYGVEKYGEVSGSYGDEYEDGCLLGCCATRALVMGTVSSSEMTICICQTLQSSIPEDSHLHERFGWTSQ